MLPFLKGRLRRNRPAIVDGLEPLPQDLNLSPGRCMQEHDIALNEAVVQKLFSMFAGNVGHKARAFEDHFERSTLAA